jgi:hypothetical protein
MQVVQHPSHKYPAGIVLSNKCQLLARLQGLFNRVLIALLIDLVISLIGAVPGAPLYGTNMPSHNVPTAAVKHTTFSHASHQDAVEGCGMGACV